MAPAARLLAATEPSDDTHSAPLPSSTIQIPCIAAFTSFTLTSTRPPAVPLATRMPASPAPVPAVETTAPVAAT